VSRSLNKVTLIGNLGADPEVRTTSNGNKVANFSLATGRQWTSPSGEKQEKTEWHKCIAWNSRGDRGPQLADVIEKYVKKGDKLFVEGAIEYRQYEDKDKQTRYVTEINVRELILLGGGRAEGGSAPAPRAKAAAGGKSASGDGFEDFPAAMDGDDDLPF
jgi:single-strand DNA-binding protein